MATIAEGRVFGLFAHTKPCRARFFRREFVRFHTSALVGAITEGLVFGQTARAEPVIFASFQFYFGRFTPCDLGCSDLIHKL